jgi:hypothetical protein
MARRRRTFTVALAWDASPSHATDHYRILYGQSSSSYAFFTDVGNVLDAMVTVHTQGTWFFAVVAVDIAGTESATSNQVATSLTSSVTPQIGTFA